MKKITWAGLLLITFSVFVFAACKKKEIQGPKGDPGTPVIGGNSNINNSAIFTIGASQWVPNPDSTAWVYTLQSPLITQDVMDKGSVKVYVKRSTSWTELPNTQGDLFMQYSFKTGFVDLSFIDIHGSLPERPVTTDYRMVTIYQSGKPAAGNSYFTQTPQSSHE